MNHHETCFFCFRLAGGLHCRCKSSVITSRSIQCDPTKKHWVVQDCKKEKTTISRHLGVFFKFHSKLPDATWLNLCRSQVILFHQAKTNEETPHQNFHMGIEVKLRVPLSDLKEVTKLVYCSMSHLTL